jgi:hypothetical protein
MGFKLGTTALNKLYLGTTEIKKAYIGSTLFYDKTTAPPSGITMVGTTEAINVTGITLPTGLAEGDVVFVLAAADADDQTTPNLPSGWTAWGGTSINYTRYALYRKVMTSTPDTTLTGIWNTAGKSTLRAVAFRGVHASLYDDAGDNVYQSNNGSTLSFPNPPQIDNSYTNSMCVVFAFASNDPPSEITGYPTGYTGVGFTRSTAGYGSICAAAYKLKAASGSETFSDSFVGTSKYGMIVVSLSLRAA